LNNYIKRPTGSFKATLRALTGLTKGKQVMGDELWVSRIAVAHPEQLPPEVRHKGQPYDLQARLIDLTANEKKLLLKCFEPQLPAFRGDQPTALLLTQPLDLIGMCDQMKKQSIYQSLATILQGAGFTVVLKNHPREVPFALANTTSIDPIMPIELWPLTGQTRFDVGLALCSASLSHGTDALCTKAIQLVSTECFTPRDFPNWAPDISDLLTKALAI